MSLDMPVAQTNQFLSRQKCKYMSAIGKKKAKPRKQNTDSAEIDAALALGHHDPGGDGVDAFRLAVLALCDA